LPLWAGQGQGVGCRVGYFVRLVGLFVGLVGLFVGGIGCVGGVGAGVDGGQLEG
jgi:hypothetical protein